MSKRSILLIYTGGTIGMIKDYETGALRAFNFDELLQNIPELHLLDCAIETRTFEQPIDSSNMNPDYWIQLAEIIEEHYDQHHGFVVLHGSDTMSYTASALSFMLENLAKPVIFTGSQLPIGDLRTDAKENLITAVQLAAKHQRGVPCINEVCLYFEYRLYRANRTVKVSAEHFQAFASPNYPPLVTSGVHLDIAWDYLLPRPRKKLQVHKTMVPDILLIKLHPGIQEEVMRQLFAIQPVRGIILETFGAGNTTSASWFIGLLQEKVQSGVPVINVTQCNGGSVQMGNYETSVQLKKVGLISGKDITTEAALAKLMYLLGQRVSAKVFKTIFETPLRGEMS
ncbi:asparaginase [Croceiramulus getboli]|nr:asparaginase [Flavobacteriaceae bacterium YJPT1-3]